MSKGRRMRVDWSRLELYASQGIWSESRLAVLLGLSPTLLHARLMSDAEFRSRWEEALNRGKVEMELRLLNRLEERSSEGDVGATVQLLRRLEKDDREGLLGGRGEVRVVVEDVDVAGLLSSAEVQEVEWSRRSLGRRLAVHGQRELEIEVEGDGEEVEEG